MKKLNLIFAIALVSLITLSSCKKEQNGNITTSFTKLEDLGSDYQYEGWLIVDGNPVSAGIFDVDASGVPSKSSFSVENIDFDKVEKYVLTIEPNPDSDPSPSKVHILAGNISNSTATLTVDDAAAIGTNFNAATGQYILATPTDGAMDTDENSGIWFLDPSGPAAGLSLPTLPEGWKYEGWAVINGTPVTTGKFTSASGSDEAAPFSGSSNGPSFPGEDFLVNAPGSLTFPTDLAGGVAVISVEPDPDNSPAPFLLKPLVGMIDAGATDHTPYDMANNAVSTNPTGTVTITVE